MKVRESGMPPEEMWQDFFDAEAVLESLGLSREAEAVVEFGCGYGTFTIPAAQTIRGPLYAIDIEPEMIRMVTAKADTLRLRNVIPVTRDFVAAGTGLPDESGEYALLFNILHAEDPVALLREAHRVLKPGGKAGVIHWNYDPSTPRGPPMAIRPRPEHCVEWGRQAGFSLQKRLDVGPYHYGLVFEKRPGGVRE